MTQVAERSRAESLDEGGRSGGRVLVLDGGEPRNGPAEASHGFFTRDGIHPGEMLKIGREQLEQYPDVEYKAGRATEASGADGAFEVALGDGKMVAARKLVLATGVLDELSQRQTSGLAGSVGCELSAPVPTVGFVKTDHMTREATVAGVYAVGDAVRPPGQSVVLAAASGATAAYVLNHTLTIQDAEDEVAAATSVVGDPGRSAG